MPQVPEVPRRLILLNTAHLTNGDEVNCKEKGHRSLRVASRRAEGASAPTAVAHLSEYCSSDQWGCRYLQREGIMISSSYPGNF